VFLDNQFKAFAFQPLIRATILERQADPKIGSKQLDPISKYK
jgi:hypothetical protein